ncbi:probable short-chain dehydrogenase [marine gamma proteobacterium HTCC2143]|jgi:3-hydroxyacyl-CoA dehydrogenase/3a,7a,12a-trihydroxy-5b-cholest-24-enoyl-CoA hydratase|uniref:Probable short-chain dehydrogenase n=1 Tax=marine gamma proteobacterium HTCC2143 TaxID=247633 RepID=A0YGV6_9GAMM|nr:probable short-chain dehydrogenase [marine gamma proteobacterium HTCC2143]|tara:strand:- start:950 stop:1963 length:1014 start_codon:yes stop_codon:yes gene_type:complete
MYMSDTTSTDTLDFTGQVALITGAGRGLGREHALLLASRGCKVVVNDLGTAYDGSGAAEGRVADEVVQLIKAAGGDAVANYDSVEDGQRVVDAAIDAYGRLDIVVNNAGILTPEVWSELTLESWQKTLNINLTGVFSIMKAAWPIFVKQQYGRSIMTASPAMYGAGVAAYAASKAGIIGLSHSLQFEARKLKLDIKCNVLIPQAGTRMTQDFETSVNETRQALGKKATPSAPEEVLQRLSPDKVSAMVVWLAHPTCHAESSIFEAGGGYFAQLNWARSAPLFATEKEGINGAPLPENIRDGQQTLADFDHGDMPKSGDGTMGAPNALQRVYRHLKSD